MPELHEKENNEKTLVLTILRSSSLLIVLKPNHIGYNIVFKLNKAIMI